MEEESARVGDSDHPAEKWQRNVLSADTQRIGVVGDEKGVVFLVPANDSNSRPRKPPPKKLQHDPSKKPLVTLEAIQEKQKLAEERKKRHDENKVRQARKVSEEARRFDEKIKAKLEKANISNVAVEEKKWFHAALKK